MLLRMRSSSSGRILAAVMFTDMVDSTSVADELGDRRWKALVNRHHRLVRRELKRFGGRELDTAGDGFFATFQEPASAIACACAAADSVRELGIEIRAGVHFGECEQIGKKLGGITVVVGARIMSLGGAGDVLVSGTAAELARGAGFGTSDRGNHVLKGVDGEWRVLSVDSVDGVPRRGPLDPAEAADRRAGIEPEAARRRPRPAIAVAALIASVVAVGAVLAIAMRGTTRSAPPGPNTLARVDAEGAGFDSVVALGAGAFPDGIAAGGGRLWVVNVTNRTLMQVDPSNGQSQVFGTPSVPTGVAFADGRVWVTYGFSSDARRRIDVLDPTDPVLGPADVVVPDGSYPIVAGGGAVWIADPLRSTVLRHDPVTGRIETVELPPGSGPIALGVGEEAPLLWVAAGRIAAVFKMNMDAAGPDASVERFGTGGDVPTALSVTPDGSVWIAERDTDSVLALSASGTTRVDTAVGNRCDAPSGIVATDDAVWVSCSGSSSVVRLDTADGSFVTELAVNGDPGPMTLDETGALWVAIRGAA